MCGIFFCTFVMFVLFLSDFCVLFFLRGWASAFSPAVLWVGREGRFFSMVWHIHRKCPSQQHLDMQHRVTTTTRSKLVERSSDIPGGREQLCPGLSPPPKETTTSCSKNRTHWEGGILQKCPQLVSRLYLAIQKLLLFCVLFCMDGEMRLCGTDWWGGQPPSSRHNTM